MGYLLQLAVVDIVDRDETGTALGQLIIGPPELLPVSISA